MDRHEEFDRRLCEIEPSPPEQQLEGILAFFSVMAGTLDDFTLDMMRHHFDLKGSDVVGSSSKCWRVQERYESCGNYSESGGFEVGSEKGTQRGHTYFLLSPIIT